MKSLTFFSCCCISALALASGCGKSQPAGTLSNPSAKAVLMELAESVQAYDASLSVSSSGPADVAEDPSSIRGGMRTRLNTLKELTAIQADVQESLRTMSEALDAVEKLSLSASPNVAQIRSELEKIKGQVDSLRKKL